MLWGFVRIEVLDLDLVMVFHLHICSKYCAIVESNSTSRLSFPDN